MPFYSRKRQVSTADLDGVRGLPIGVAGCRIYSGAGAPEGVVTAVIGSLFLRNDGSTSTTLYVKTSGSGNTGWTAK